MPAIAGVKQQKETVQEKNEVSFSYKKCVLKMHASVPHENCAATAHDKIQVLKGMQYFSSIMFYIHQNTSPELL